MRKDSEQNTVGRGRSRGPPWSSKSLGKLGQMEKSNFQTEKVYYNFQFIGISLESEMQY